MNKGASLVTSFNYWPFFFNFMAHKFGPRYIRRPLNAQIEVTLKCNAKCRFCEIWRPAYQKTMDLNGPEMTTGDIKHVIDELAKNKVLVCSFTGGEPTLRPDIGDLIDYAASKRLMTGMATNGYYLEELVNNGKLDNLDVTMVSLDFPFASKHDEYRGIKVFNRAIKGIEALRKKGQSVLISTVVTKEGLQYMGQMAELAKKLGASIEMLPVENIARSVYGKPQSLKDVGKEFIPDIKQWATQIRKLKKKYKNITTDNISIKIIESGGFGRNEKFGLIEKLFSWKVNYIPCYVASSYAFINYSGKMVFPCKLHPILSESVLKYPLERIFHSEEVQEIQKKGDSFDFCKGCRFGCGLSGSMALYWSTIWEKYLAPGFNGNY